ncbi:hypothetical protein [Streptomyces sp. STR69]|uniref:hypothetical protein n=1 Tax=Streptomyces sp. STR69 TaxID=1796942 RepID=UPI0021C945D0|nr:hypothetical protein [Streptomyces sp. STR69]
MSVLVEGRREAVGMLAVNVAWAVAARPSLRRRARTAGIPLTPDVLARRQTRQLRVLRPSVGWSDRMRTELKASDRASVTAEKGREEVWFQWRPGRRRHTVWGSITFDEPSGTVLLDLREGAAYTGVSGVRRGASFVALCQVAGGLGLVGVEGQCGAGGRA